MRNVKEITLIKRYVFLDRDGTLNVDTHYLSHPDQVVLLPGVVQGLHYLQAMGFRLIVLTNQSGVARGYFNETQVTAVHARLRGMLMAEGVILDAFYFCPHAPDDHCACRKPRPGLLDQVRRDHNFNPEQAYIIGDKDSDIVMGKVAGIRTILVCPDLPADSSQRGSDTANCVTPDFLVKNLVEAAMLIISTG